MIAQMCLPSETLTAQERTVEVHQKAICLKTEDSVANTATISTCFLVSHQGKYFLVSAGHAINARTSSTWILSSAFDSPSQSIQVPQACATKWQAVGKYDATVLPLGELTNEFSLFAPLKPLCIPTSSFVDSAPRRGRHIAYVGFPIGLGATPPLSSIMFSGEIASGEIRTTNSNEESPVILSTPGAMSGTSGAPVFMIDEASKSEFFVGLVCGYIGDATGSKLTKIVPAWHLKQAFVEIANSTGGAASPNNLTTPPKSTDMLKVK